MLIEANSKSRGEMHREHVTKFVDLAAFDAAVDGMIGLAQSGRFSTSTQYLESGGHFPKRPVTFKCGAITTVRKVLLDQLL